MDSDQGKIFIGGISWDTNEDKLKDHFERYGEVIQTVVMRDKVSGKPRGFGFVVFADPEVVDSVLQDRHTIDGRTVEAKRALSREEQQQTTKAGNVNSSSDYGGAGNKRTKKIFVGGLPPTLTEDEFRGYFGTFGNVTDVVIMYDQQTNRPRGFGFVSFDSEDAVDRVLRKTFHDLNSKQVEVKRAFPKDHAGGRSTKMDYSNRYMQSQNTGPTGYTTYGTPGYGYPSSSGMGYSGYGSYGYGNGPRNYPQGPTYGNMGYGAAAPIHSMSVYGNQGYGYGGAPRTNLALAGGYGGFGNAGWRSDLSQSFGYGGSFDGSGYGRQSQHQ